MKTIRSGRSPPQAVPAVPRGLKRPSPSRSKTGSGLPPSPIGISTGCWDGAVAFVRLLASQEPLAHGMGHLRCAKPSQCSSLPLPQNISASRPGDLQGHQEVEKNKPRLLPLPTAGLDKSAAKGPDKPESQCQIPEHLRCRRDQPCLLASQNPAFSRKGPFQVRHCIQSSKLLFPSKQTARKSKGQPHW